MIFKRIFLASDQCRLSSARPPSSIVCEDIVEDCTDSYVCPTSPQEGSLVRLCDISRVCQKDGQVVSKSSLCPGGKYNAQLNQCVQKTEGKSFKHFSNYLALAIKNWTDISK